jgi:hypothetical protein
MTTRVGWWYATGPVDQEYYPGHPAFSLHTVISDESSIPGHVTVENPAGQQFPAANLLIGRDCGPSSSRPGQTLISPQMRRIWFNRRLYTGPLGIRPASNTCSLSSEKHRRRFISSGVARWDSLPEAQIARVVTEISIDHHRLQHSLRK